MNLNYPIVMLVEDCPTTACLVERVVMHELPECRLLWARSVQEATQRAESLQIELFITDVGLPDGTGFDLLWKAAASHPDARAIVITATPLPEYEAHSAALGVLDFLEKPLKLPKLIDRVRQALDLPEAINHNRDFRATLEHVTAADLIQLKCLGRATTLMQFQSEGRVGSVRFVDGDITHAECGELVGLDAFFEILGWGRGHVSERPFFGSASRSITGSWQALLMEAAQRTDELRAAAA
jgi:CheY-like chemotaxis protein